MTNDLLALKYTEIKPCELEGFPDAHTVYLTVGPQKFCVTSIAMDTLKEAEFMQEMLVKAIAQIIKNEC